MDQRTRLSPYRVLQGVGASPTTKKSARSASLSRRISRELSILRLASKLGHFFSLATPVPKPAPCAILSLHYSALTPERPHRSYFSSQRARVSFVSLAPWANVAVRCTA